MLLQIKKIYHINLVIYYWSFSIFSDFFFWFVENYSYLQCPDCGKKISVFGKSHIDEIAAQFQVPVLAKLPIDPSVAEAFDYGMMESVNTDALNGAIEAVLKA